MENRSEAPDFLKRLRVQTKDRSVALGHDNAKVLCLGNIFARKKKGNLVYGTTQSAWCVCVRIN